MDLFENSIYLPSSSRSVGSLLTLLDSLYLKSFALFFLYPLKILDVNDLVLSVLHSHYSNM